MENQQLLDYINQQIAQGADKEQIRKSLMASGGWSEEDISNAFSSIADSIKPPQPPLSGRTILYSMTDEKGFTRFGLECIILFFSLILLFTGIGPLLLFFLLPFFAVIGASLRYYKKIIGVPLEEAEQGIHQSALQGRELGRLFTFLVLLSILFSIVNDFVLLILLPVTAIVGIITLVLSIFGYIENRKDSNIDKKVASATFFKSNIGFLIASVYLFLILVLPMILFII